MKECEVIYAYSYPMCSDLEINFVFRLGAEASPVHSRPADHKQLIHQTAVDFQIYDGDDDDADDNDVISPFLCNNKPVHIRSYSDGFCSFDRSSLSSDGSDLSHDKKNGFIPQQNSHKKYSVDSGESGIVCDIASNGSQTDSDSTLKKSGDFHDKVINGYRSTEHNRSAFSFEDSLLQQDIVQSSKLNGNVCKVDSDFYCSDSDIEIIRIVTKL